MTSVNSENQSESAESISTDSHRADATPVDRERSTIVRSAVPELSMLPSPTVREQAAAATISQIGNYEILGEIARGGMGVVYKARQLGVNRIVALKMTLAGQFAGDEERRRFRAEAEAAGQLDHPNIVPIHEVGEHNGQPFFSMGYVEGESLKGLLADGPLPPRRAAELMRTIAEAVHYAHTKGIVHRDLKPANVLIDSGGQPRVTDFGLAKQATTDSSLTATGQILGTPSFMPPEQAMGKIDQIGPTSDVYSLGAMLYCLLTGRPPFQAATVMDTLLQVVEQEPASLRTLNPVIPKDLEIICLKALRKSPVQRYRDAAVFSEDLQAFLIGQPIAARPSHLFDRCRGWFLRHRVLGTMLLAGFTGILTTAAVFLFLPGTAGAFVTVGFGAASFAAVAALIGLLVWAVGNSNDSHRTQQQLEYALQDVEECVLRLADQGRGHPFLQQQILQEFQRFFERWHGRSDVSSTTYQQALAAAERLATLTPRLASRQERIGETGQSASNRLSITTVSVAIEGRFELPKPRHWTKRRLIAVAVAVWLLWPSAFILLGRTLTRRSPDERLEVVSLLFGIFGVSVPIAISFVSPPIWYLRRQLRHHDPRRRAESAVILARLGSKARRVVATLSACLEDPNRTVRIAAARALAAIGDPGGLARSNLKDAASGNDVLVAAECLKALQNSGSERHATDLRKEGPRRLGSLFREVVVPSPSGARHRTISRLLLLFLRGAAISVASVGLPIAIGHGLDEILRPVPREWRNLIWPAAALFGGLLELARIASLSRRRFELFGLSQHHTQIFFGGLSIVLPLILLSQRPNMPREDPRLGMMFAFGIVALLDSLLPRVVLEEPREPSTGD